MSKNVINNFFISLTASSVTGFVLLFFTKSWYITSSLFAIGTLSTAIFCAFVTWLIEDL